ncbi:DNA-binding MarR family transcriptional regulator [Isoptericola jiangsuensis]|uniref:DNA-binding MarR family transcriptional regulator n=1 Tax=Isoptericola jiangsuensis TaxID=548579 RepID=A0A2A9F1T9_9MICO|nr:MarR family transcriptional regulator [Isoptericola jiangsuensis]PFG44425.1 DNA-binding MarR family transcriptional regulator [Isoptericola jiangsuensis]
MDEPDHVARIQDAWRRERPDLDVAPQGIIGRLHRLAAHLDDELAVVYARHGLGFGEFDVLATLRRAGAPYERAPGEIAQHTMVTTGAVTKRLDRLVAAGLVERRRAEDDGRRRVVALTPEGLRVIDTAFTEHMANERRLVDQLSGADQAALADILRRWLTAYE